MYGFLKGVSALLLSVFLLCACVPVYAEDITPSVPPPVSDSAPAVAVDSPDADSSSSVVPSDSSSLTLDENSVESELSTPTETSPETQPRYITTTRLNDYTVTEALLLILVCIAVLALFLKIFGL